MVCNPYLWTAYLFLPKAFAMIKFKIYYASPMKSMFLKIGVLFSLLTPIKAARYAIQLSGVSFHSNVRETGTFTDLPDTCDIQNFIPSENEHFLDQFKVFCLDQVSHQFSSQFYNAVHPHGLTYKQFMNQNEVVDRHLTILAQLILEHADLTQPIESPEEHLPAVCFFKKSATEPLNVQMVWNTFAHPVELMVRVKVVEDA